MSAIKKYVQSDKEWVTFGETNVLSNELSSARNISVDFGACESVNDILKSHEEDIEKIKRNVAWLALHGGGGSGGGSGGGGSGSRKATCTIKANGSTGGSFSIVEGQSITITLENCTPKANSDPWDITVTFDSATLVTTTKTPISQTITINIDWVTIRDFFTGEGATASHRLYVNAKYKKVQTDLPGEESYEGFVYIPTIDCSITNKSMYDVQESTQAIATANIDTALTGWFKVIGSISDYRYTSDDLEICRVEKKSVSLHEPFDLSAMLNYAPKPEYKSGIYQTSLSIVYENPTSHIDQVVYQKSEQIIFYDSKASGSLVNVYGISTKSASPTVVFDNLKNFSFIFYAFNGNESQLLYDVELVNAADPSERIVALSGVSGAYKVNNNVRVNLKSEPKFSADKVFNLTLTVRQLGTPEERWTRVQCYVKCSQGSYQFLNYQPGEKEGQANKVISFNSFSEVFSQYSKLQPNMTVVTDTSAEDAAAGVVSSFFDFSYINNRSGVMTASDSVKSVQLFNTYLDIKNRFDILKKDIKTGEYYVDSDSIARYPRFTVGITYKAQKYTSDDHIIFAMCENGNPNQGITIRTDGVYIKSARVAVKDAKTISTVHIEYNTGSENQVWDDTKSCVKVFIDGVITAISKECPFSVDKDTQDVKLNDVTIHINGVTNDLIKDRQYSANCSVYNFELFKTALNNIDILASSTNAKVLTNYKGELPDFDLIESELKKNCCSYNELSHSISTDIYVSLDNKWQYAFNSLFFDNGEVPKDVTKQTYYCEKLSSMSIPIVYIDAQNGKSHETTTGQPIDSDWWKFNDNGFLATDRSNFNKTIRSTLYYWDPSKNMMPISADNVDVSLQGTSTSTDKIKNVKIKFAESINQQGTTVRDLFYVKTDWIPENTYVLKADVVDSSHANNASIGKFINDTFEYGNKYGFGFDGKGVAKSNIDNTKVALQNQQWLTIDPKLKHTVEGFQVMLFIRFYQDKTYRNIGIYSFNIGRDAARNLGFENIESILDENGIPFTNINAPHILHKAQVKSVPGSTEIYWVENKDSQNYEAVSAWVPGQGYMVPDAQTGLSVNPPREARFWHGTITEDGGKPVQDYKLDKQFDVEYTNAAEKPASQISLFSLFVDQIAKLPIEGLMSTSAGGKIAADIAGSYDAWICDTNGKYTRAEAAHSLRESIDSQMITSFSLSQLQKYYVIAMLFGLIDNFDKNVSFRVFGSDQVLADFYDLDTALGLDNVGENSVSPLNSNKLIINHTPEQGVQFPEETYNLDKMNEMYTSAKTYPSSYKKFLPEVYTNKIWMSLDSNAMRVEEGGVKYSMYSNEWFQLRAFLDKLYDKTKYSSFADYFIGEYFAAHQKIGTLIYNYDYMMKYLNDYEQTGVPQKNDTSTELHGLRVDEAKEWLQQHIDYLDSYFIWRNAQKFIGDDTRAPDDLNSVVRQQIEITMNSATPGVKIETEYPVIVHTILGANASEVGDTFIPYNNSASIKVPGGGTGKNFAIKCASLLKNFDFRSLKISKFRLTYGIISNIEDINLDGLTIVKTGFNLDDFVDTSSSEINVLSKISMKKTSFSDGFTLNLNRPQLLNVSYVDISESTNITRLDFFHEDSSSENVSQNLKYLNVDHSDIAYLTLRDQSYLVLPSINNCNSLTSLAIYNCNLDNFDEAHKADISNYMDLDLSAHLAIKNVDLQNVEHVKSVRVRNCPNFDSLTLKNISALTSLTIENNPRLKKIELFNCPKLSTVTIQECSAFTDLAILSVSNLQELVLNYDNSLSGLSVSQDSVSGITEINLRNANISGFNYYNPISATYDSIAVDPRGNKVLDFAPFKSLKTNGITIRKNASQPYNKDKCANFTAIRFPNDPARAFNLLDGNHDDIGIRFTNLRNIYGHARVTSNSEIGTYTQPFLSSGAEYKGYPKFIQELSPKFSTYSELTVLQNKTMFDLIQQKSQKVREAISSEVDLSKIEQYLSADGFLSCTSTDGLSVQNIVEFDDREWATNYTVDSLGWAWVDSGTLDEFTFQYLLYRYAISIRAKQTAGTANNFYRMSKYIPSSYPSLIKFPTNTFRYIGRTMQDIRSTFATLPDEYKYLVTRDVMKYVSKITTYCGLSNRDILCYDALIDSASTLTALGNTNDSSNIWANSIKALSGSSMDPDHDYGNDFLNTLTSLKDIKYFQPSTTNFHLSSATFPQSVRNVINSFTSFGTSEFIDLKTLFTDCCYNLVEVYKSFGSAQMLLKPSAFKHAMDLTAVVFNDNVKKYIIEDTISIENFLASYSSSSGKYFIRKSYTDPTLSVQSEIYTQDQFRTFTDNILTSNRHLFTTTNLFASADIPYQNIYENRYYEDRVTQLSSIGLKMSTNMFKYNTELTSLASAFKDVNFKYQLVSNMFENLSALKTVNAIFQNTPSLFRGVVSCIPGRLFYTGITENRTENFVGSDRFDDAIMSYNDCMNTLSSGFRVKKLAVGNTSYSWDQLSSEMTNTGILNVESFSDLSAHFLTGDTAYEFVDLVNDMSSYEEFCPLVSCVEEGGEPVERITPGGERLVNTLSTLFRGLSDDVEAWEDDVCSLKHQEFTHPVFNRQLNSVSYCFSGNCNITPYDGPTVPEPNDKYSPYKLNYNPVLHTFTKNFNRNTLSSDASWTCNGGIYKLEGSTWVIDPTVYRSDCYNVTTPDLSVLSSNVSTVVDLSGSEDFKVTYEGVDSFRRTKFVFDGKEVLTQIEYILFANQVREFKYICAPDLFRYCNPDIQAIEYVFNKCDNFVNSVAMECGSSRFDYNKGLTGRIPPNLFHTLPSLRMITGMFKQCYHITGYQSKKPGEEKVHSYLIPADLFKYSQHVYDFTEAFYGLPIKYSPDFETPFAYILAAFDMGSAGISFKSTFARCIWCNIGNDASDEIGPIWANKYYSSIDNAFENTLGTYTHSIDASGTHPRIVNTGATIGVRPRMNVFNIDASYLPNSIRQVYYGSETIPANNFYIVDNDDKAKATVTTSASIRIRI